MKTSQAAQYQLEQALSNISVIRDGYSNINTEEIEAIIRSGQYFVTIATKLDLLAQHIKKGNQIEEHHLQKIISELLFIQSHYKIKKKAKTTRP